MAARILSLTTLLASASAAPALPSALPPGVLGAQLTIEWCDAGNPLQAFVQVGGGALALQANLSLCIASVGDTTLEMQVCSGAASQAFSFPGDYTVRQGAFAWNDQWGSDVQGAGGFTRLYPSSSLGFNSYFTALSGPLAGRFMANFTQAGNATLSGLCVTATPPPPPSPPPLPTAAQAAWQDGDVGCFVHYNMATMAGSQGCGGGAPPPISAWNPSALDTDSWVQTCKAMGGVRIIYVAKHGCGFAAWRSNVSDYGYAYSVNSSPRPDVDVVAQLVASAKRANIGYGFYYSTVSNAYANVEGGVVQPGPINPALQINVTQVQYNDLVLKHLTELYSAFGQLTEVWFDGGYQPALGPPLRQLFATLQPNVVAFQGEGLVASPIRWVGTESGLAPYPCWSTCDYAGSGAGDPAATTWFAAETDFTLQRGDNWFYSAAAGVHSAAELRQMYETSVGHNTALIIDIAPFPNGTVPAAQAAAAASLGSFVTACYSAPLLQGSGNTTLITLMPSMPIAIDRVLIQEDIRLGQLVRGFVLSARLQDGSSQTLFSGPSIGNKFISVLATPLTVASVTLNITAIAELAPSSAPYITNFALFSCSSLAAESDAAWAATGF